MNNVVCVKWGSLYDSDYVNNLYAMVKRNLTLPFRFICFTDDPAGCHHEIDIKFLPKHLEGWWGKVYYFKNPLEDIIGPVLTLDLDLIIVDNIDCMFEYEPDHFLMKQVPNRENYFNSAVMRFESNQYSHIYDRLDLEKIEYAIDNRNKSFKTKQYQGDQDWITEQMLNDPIGRKVKVWPKKWVLNFKIDCLRNKKTKMIYPKPPKNKMKSVEFFVPDNAKIIIFTGYTYNNKNYYQLIKQWWHANDLS